MTAGLGQLAAFFFEVGAFSFSGGLSMLAFIQDQVVNQFGWLTPEQFIDCLAVGQLTPGPVLMLAALIGFSSPAFRARRSRHRRSSCRRSL